MCSHAKWKNLLFLLRFPKDRNLLLNDASILQLFLCRHLSFCQFYNYVFTLLPQKRLFSSAIYCSLPPVKWFIQLQSIKSAKILSTDYGDGKCKLYWSFIDIPYLKNHPSPSQDNSGWCTSRCKLPLFLNPFPKVMFVHIWETICQIVQVGHKTLFSRAKRKTCHPEK